MIQVAAILLTFWVPEAALALFAGNCFGWWVGDGCCGPTGLVCPACSSGTTPTQVQLDVSGWANNLCSECTSLNGTFILDQTTILSNCDFQKSIGPYCSSNYTNYEVQLFDTAGTSQIVITTCGGNDQFHIGTAPTPTAPFDCSVSHASATLDSNGCSTRCNASSVTIAYTPLAPFK